MNIVRAVLYVSCLIASAMNCAAQSKAPVTPSRPHEIENFRATVAQAKLHAKANNIVGIEAALVTMNRAKPNTANWHTETAQRLIDFSVGAARENRPAVARGLITSAQQHLALAETLAPDARAKATARMMTGQIQERFTGEPVAALASYQAAAKLAPESKRAAQAAARLQESLTKLQAGNGGGK